MQPRQAKHSSGAYFKLKRRLPTDKAGRNFDEGRGCDRETNEHGQTTRQHLVGQDAHMLRVVLKLDNVIGSIFATQKVGLRRAPHTPDHLQRENSSASRVTTQA
jgi:hypothetical protein